MKKRGTQKITSQQKEYGEPKASHKDCQIRKVEFIYPSSKRSICKYYVWRSWMYIIMVSSAHPYASNIYESYYCLLVEKRRHVRSSNWFMIHPFSLIRMYWEVVMVGAQLIVLFATPMELTFCGIHYSFMYLQLVADSFGCICFFDTLSNFVTGYITTYSVSMELKDVVAHYLKTCFFLDCVSTFPWGFFSHFYYPYTTKGHWYLVRLVFFLRLYRYKRFIECLSVTCKLFKFRDIVYCALSFSIFSALVWVWIITAQIFLPSILTCDCFYRTPLIGHPEKTSEVQQLMNAFFVGSAYFTFTGSSMRNMLTWDEIAIEVLSTTSSFAWQIYALAYITYQLIPIDTSPVKYQMMNRQLGAYITTKRLPPATKRRIELYYEHRYRKTFFREQKILGNMSERLRRDVQLHDCEKMIRGMSLFQKMPHHIVAKLAPCLRMDMILPNEVIIKAGSIGDEMYFLHSGTVAIYARWGEEVRHMEDGGYFGEVAMVLKNERRLASVTAVTVCELYILTRPDFLRVLRPFRELYRGIERIARERLEQMVLRESQRREQRRLEMKEQRKKGGRREQESDESSEESDNIDWGDPGSASGHAAKDEAGKNQPPTTESSLTSISDAASPGGAPAPSAPDAGPSTPSNESPPAPPKSPSSPSHKP